jgi:3'-5' exoribonuclease
MFRREVASLGARCARPQRRVGDVYAIEVCGYDGGLTASERESILASRTLIKDLKPNQLVEGVFAINNCQLGQTRSGKPFLKCLISDSSGRLAGRFWNVTEEQFKRLPTDGFVRLEGQTQPYQGELQLIIQQIAAAQPTDADLASLLPHTQRNIDEMFEQVKVVMSTLEHPAIKALIEVYLQDDELMTKFQAAPAAMTLHHAFIGGLLEHTSNLLRLAEVFCPLYPQLNRDIILAGLFLHDLGKCVELTWSQGFGYSDEGQLVGHVARGVIWLQRKAEDCAAMGHEIPEPILMVLQHIILSHHSRPEFGALKIPSTPEAIAVSLMDNIDAKMDMALRAARDGEAPSQATNLRGNFTEKIWALETRLYRPDPTKLTP